MVLSDWSLGTIVISDLACANKIKALHTGVNLHAPAFSTIWRARLSTEQSLTSTQKVARFVTRLHKCCEIKPLKGSKKVPKLVVKSLN